MSRRYHVRTYGCQMNLHDSEKVENLLHHAGWRPAAGLDDAELLLINTCTIREKAEHRLASDLGALRAGAAPRLDACSASGAAGAAGGRCAVAALPAPRLRVRHPQPAARARAGGCGGRRRAPRRDRREPFARTLRPPGAPPGLPGPHARSGVAHGDGGLRSLLLVLHRAAHARARDQPARSRDHRRGAAARGGRRRRADPARSDGERLRAARGAPRARRAAGRPLRGAARAARRDPGLARLRYTSPHPRFFDQALVRAHATLATLRPHVHLPLQSGSDRVLRA